MSGTILSVTEKINQLRGEGRRVLVTLDGPCASGKTTLAKWLAERLGGIVIHTDDYVVPHTMKTPERLSIPGGNCHWERLMAEVLEPWNRGQTVYLRKYLWHEQKLTEPEKLPETDLLILEGSYCNLPEIRKYASLCLFMETPAEVRRSRLEQRETPESVRRYDEIWIPLENAYFAAYHLPDERCQIIQDSQCMR